MSCLSQNPESKFVVETEHFIIKWESQTATQKEVLEAKIRVESFYNRFEKYLGKEVLPSEKIIVHLAGIGFNEETREVRIPHVNSNGEIFIYRFAHGYFGELAHEMVHAFRWFNGFSGDWFTEEALAEALSSILFHEVIGFNRYGYSMTVAAGVWIENQKYIPLKILKENHRKLSLKCQAQSYAIRSDFFMFLESHFGKDKFLEFVYDPNVASYKAYDEYFSKSFEQLEKMWLTNLKHRISKTPNFHMLQKKYLNNTAIQYLKVCESGVDY